jgi:hypothetical protein
MTACALVKGDVILKREVCVLVDAQAAEPQISKKETPFVLVNNHATYCA